MSRPDQLLLYQGSLSAKGCFVNDIDLDLVQLCCATPYIKSCLVAPYSEGRMPFAPTVWPLWNRGYVFRIWY